jgi:hypothetical protein
MSDNNDDKNDDQNDDQDGQDDQDDQNDDQNDQDTKHTRTKKGFRSGYLIVPNLLNGCDKGGEGNQYGATIMPL